MPSAVVMSPSMLLTLLLQTSPENGTCHQSVSPGSSCSVEYMGMGRGGNVISEVFSQWASLFPADPSAHVSTFALARGPHVHVIMNIPTGSVCRIAFNVCTGYRGSTPSPTRSLPPVLPHRRPTGHVCYLPHPVVISS